MTDFTLTIPSDLYERAEQIAQITSRPVDTILLEQLELWAQGIPLLETNEEAELQALKYLSDDALWTIAHETLKPELQEKMQPLMDKNSSGKITTEEKAELTQLVERGERLMLRKSQAMALLSQRGFSQNWIIAGTHPPA